MLIIYPHGLKVQFKYTPLAVAKDALVNGNVGGEPDYAFADAILSEILGKKVLDKTAF